ncbi:MAG: hypothetical protein HZA50_05845 [Planctomycetes bacterium]|nr:hypothetical protein [Planctomycetota bacterium]
MMSCDTIRQQISGCLDSGRPLPDRVRDHIDSCRPCREFHEACRGIGERLAADAASGCPAVGPLLRDAVMARCSQVRPGAATARNWRRIFIRFSAAALATAALITLAILIRPAMFKQPLPSPAPVVIVPQPHPDQGGTRLVAWLVSNPDIVPQSLNKAGQAVREPVKQQTDLLMKKGADFASTLLAAMPIKPASPPKPQDLR